MKIKISKAVFVFIVVSIASCSSDKSNEENKNEIPVNVTVAKPYSNNQNSIEVTGQIESAITANISTKIMGYITKLNVKVGDKVSKGQLLVTINSDDIAAKKAQTDALIAEAEANYKNAQKDLDRFNNLFNQQSASAKELDNIKLQHNSAKSRYEVAKQMRNEINSLYNYTHLVAPFSGTVTQKLADAGSMSSPGMPLLTIEQSGSFVVSVSVPENIISEIKLNTEALINVSSINKSFKGKVNQINQSSQYTGGQYMVKIAIADADKKDLYSGMYATVSIATKTNKKMQGNNEVILIPTSAIENKNELNGIYTISENNTALLRWIRLGKIFGDKVEVLSGLDKNEQIITSSDGKLYNGISVKVK